jgi:cyclopropane-fatty-acyl-phospholipid synthase
MTSTIIPVSDKVDDTATSGWQHRLARKLVLRQLAKITDGQLQVQEGEQQWVFGSLSARLPAPVVVRIVNASAWLDFAFGGSAAAGEAYVKGYWECDALTNLTRLFVRNRDALEAFDANRRWLLYPLQQLGYWLRRNTRHGSRRNIQAHYDIGNDLFRLFLDEKMMYSSAYYPGESASLDEAAEAKLDRVCRKLELSPQHHLLEIGTGWGGLAIHAAKHYGCRVTTTTISREQYELAQQRVAEEKLADRVEVLFEDYRDLDGRYDRIVSIEMIEAVGHQFMQQYFARCSHLLKDDGRMLIQAITITDRYYQEALRDVDFIKRYIFPGGFLPSVTEMANALTGVTDMKISHLEDMAYHYARTLRDWRDRFLSRLEQVKALGYPEEFIRLWDFYLCYSEGGFMERHCGVVQMVLSKPDDTPADVCY